LIAAGRTQSVSFLKLPRQSGSLSPLRLLHCGEYPCKADGGWEAYSLKQNPSLSLNAVEEGRHSHGVFCLVSSRAEMFAEIRGAKQR
jgi:hypothetical protein